MFFQAITTFLILILFAWLAWKWIIKPILAGHGIEVEDEKSIVNQHTKTLDQLKKEYDDKSASAQASSEGLVLAKQIDAMSKFIKKNDQEKEDIK